MRLNSRHLALVIGTKPEAPPDPILARLEAIEAALANLPPAQISRVQSVSYDDSAVMARLERIENQVKALLAKDLSASYNFTVKRDRDGKMSSVLAEKITSENLRPAIYKGS
jgi:hypothetical protein